MKYRVLISRHDVPTSIYTTFEADPTYSDREAKNNFLDLKKKPELAMDSLRLVRVDRGAVAEITTTIETHNYPR